MEGRLDNLKGSLSRPVGGGGGGVAPGQGGPPEKKAKDKVKPMSKRLSSSISLCSSKMNEVLVWQSKLQENKVGLHLSLLKGQISSVGVVFQTSLVNDGMCHIYIYL